MYCDHSISRPLRIEYPGAWYHVMSRGAGLRGIFLSNRNDHRQLYLDLLGVEIHGYCLMDNRYHLLLRTPQGGLRRATRHLNGVYTLRCNRMEEGDGPLFRGCYKAILLKVDAYLPGALRELPRRTSACVLVQTARFLPQLWGAPYVRKCRAAGG